MRPTGRSLLLGCVALLLSFATPLGNIWLDIWMLGGMVCVLLLIWDAWRCRTWRPPVVERTVAQSLPVGVWSKVKLVIRNRSGKGISIRIHDHYPDIMAARDMPVSLRIRADEWSAISYRIRPLARGRHLFQKAQILLGSPLGFWFRSLRLGEQTEVRVYPNFRDVSKYTLLAIDHRLSQLGIHRRQKRGEGRDFHQLREFVQGDSMRQIDWKASSRVRKVISREYQDERDQQVVFLMDCGQTMRAQDDALSHFDHALNAVLLMANTALRHGDAVGLMTFSGDHRRLAARKGGAQLNLILNKVYDIEPSLQTSDYLGVARDVLTFLKKRALLILVTNLRDEDEYELAPAIHLLRQKHLVLLASMREQIMDDLTERPVHTFHDAVKMGAAHAFLHQRTQMYDRLKAEGILCLDTVPKHLPVTMINSYLDIKSKGLL